MAGKSKNAVDEIEVVEAVEAEVQPVTEAAQAEEQKVEEVVEATAQEAVPEEAVEATATEEVEASAEVEVEAKVEAEVSVEDNKKEEAVEATTYKKLKLPKPVTIYRGPNTTFGGKSFGGVVEVIGATDEAGFTPVAYVRAGFGKTTGYIRLTKGDMDRCQLSK